MFSAVSFIITSLCYFCKADEVTHSYVLRVGMSRYYNKYSTKQDGSKCDQEVGNGSHCDVNIRINYSGCTSCRFKRTLHYPNSKIAYEDTTSLVKRDFKYKTLSIPVNLTYKALVTLEVTVFDIDLGTDEIVFNDNISFEFNHDTKAEKWQRRLLPSDRKAKTRLQDLIVEVRYAIMCAPGSCGSNCAVPDNTSKCIDNTLVCTDKDYYPCELRAGHFEYKVKLLKIITLSEENKTIDSCTNDAYACVDNQCDFQQPLLNTSYLVLNKMLATHFSDSFYSFKVNMTKIFVNFHVLVVSVCDNKTQKTMFSLGEMDELDTSLFYFSNKHIFSTGIMQLGCQAGFTGPFCSERCDDCIVDQWLCAESKCLSRAFAPERLCAQNPCWNDALCTVERVQTTRMWYHTHLEDFKVQCECKPGYSGQFCEIKHGVICLYKQCKWFEYCNQSYLARENRSISECKCTNGINRDMNTKSKLCIRHNSIKKYSVTAMRSSSNSCWLSQMCNSVKYSCHSLHTLCIEDTCKVFLEEIGNKIVFPRTKQVNETNLITGTYVNRTDISVSIKVRVLITSLDSSSIGTNPVRSLYKHLKMSMFKRIHFTGHDLFNLTDTEVGTYIFKLYW